jgi:tRNA(Ile)-lysidine synthase
VSITTPAILELRAAVRPFLDALSPHEKVLVGVSGGADSMALAHTLLHEATSRELEIIPVVVDHGLQPGSEKVAATTIEKLRSLGFDEIFFATAQVEMKDGLEASARRARYAIFEQALDTYSSRAFFLGHTLNDQAETVLLGLARGSGARSLAGMADVNGVYVRPLLQVTRASTEAACVEAGIDFWVDPHNSNPEFTRVRVRQTILPLLENEIGPGVSAALARTARLLRQDDEALSEWANHVCDGLDLSDIPADRLAALPAAIRARVLRRAIYEAGAPSGSISAEHLSPVEALVTEWRGQGEVSLPGGVKVSRNSGRLILSTPSQPS